MFRHYYVILRGPVINTLPSYTSISNAVVGNTSYNEYVSHRYNVSSHVIVVNPYPTAFPYGNSMVLHFYQQQESSTTKTVHKVINKGLKTYV